MPAANSPAPTHYDVLEVSPQASAPTIRAAYKSLMQRHHPDRLGSADAQRLAQRINAAYEVLADEQQRRRYDAELARTRAPSRPPPTAPTSAPPAAAPHAASAPPRDAAPASRVARILGAVLTLLFLAVGVGAWWWAMPPAQWQVGTVQYDPGSPVVQVVARIVSSRDERGVAQAELTFQTADRRPFRVSGQDVASGSSRVRYDCARRRFNSTQNRMVLSDGSAVDLVDAVGEVTPRSASERAMELACASWWRRWNLQ